MKLKRCFSPAVCGMRELLWFRFCEARRRWMIALEQGDCTLEPRTAARTALNTWYSFCQKYNQLRTDIGAYWPAEMS